MNKRIYVLIVLAMIVVGCKKVSVDFTYAPEEPRAGESVLFSNSSSGGEKWNWDFGDNSTSSSKSPRHTFKKAGTYLVTLRVDSARNQMCSKSITVYDTVPTFVCSSDTIKHYQNVTFTANIYNPYSYGLSYTWTLPSGCVLQSGRLTDKSITVYFKEYGTEQRVGLRITQGDKAYNIERGWYVYESLAPALLMMRSDSTIVRQRLIGDYREDVLVDDSEEDRCLLLAMCDTIVEYNDTVFTLGRLEGIIGSVLQRVQMDKVARKWYFVSSDGLFVANFNGTSAATAIRCIDSTATGAFYVDNVRNLLYWSNGVGVWGMPLVKSMDNKYVSVPVQYNEELDVVRIAFNNESR